MEPRACVFHAAGTNCDRETARAFERAGATADIVPVRELQKRPARLQDYQILCLPGGFTYGDDLGAGQLLALEIRSFLADAMEAFVDRGGLVLGICNGFQVLVRAGLLPNLEGEGRRNCTLGPNDSNRFESRWIHLRVDSKRSPFLEGIDRLFLPVAHGEGKFLTDGPGTLERLAREELVALRYVDEKGNPGPYPTNPNGSVEDVAGITDPTGRILGLMPHPERNVAFHHAPTWTRNEADAGAGLAIFRNAVAHAS